MGDLLPLDLLLPGVVSAGQKGRLQLPSLGCPWGPQARDWVCGGGDWSCPCGKGLSGLRVAVAKRTLG